MSTMFTPATRTNVPLLLGFSGGTGSGKTFSAMRVAKGICGDKPFAVIDTESGRARHYADQFKFDHADIKAPFRPQTYLDAIVAAEQAGYPAVVVDSMSHVWAGEGGVLDWHEEALYRMAGDNYGKREACKFAAWIEPKREHKKMVQRLLQMRCHVILCFRAEPKIEIRKEDGKTKVVAKESLTGLDGWQPICDKMLPFELTASFLLMADKPGVVRPIKLQEQHRPFVSLESPITEAVGASLAEWARGGAANQPQHQPPALSFTPPEGWDAWGNEERGTYCATLGTDALKSWWATLSAADRKALKPRLDGEWKSAAEASDRGE